MAGVQTKCPFCNTFVTGQQGVNGIVGECPVCDKTFTIPNVNEVPAPVAPEQPIENVGEFTCPECGAQNIVPASFIGTLQCVGCHRNIDVIDDSVQVCPNCGKYVPAEDKVCIYCSKPLQEEMPTPAAPIPQMSPYMPPPTPAPVQPAPVPMPQPAPAPVQPAPAPMQPAPAPMPQPAVSKDAAYMPPPSPAQMLQSKPPVIISEPQTVPLSAPAPMPQPAPAPVQPAPIPQPAPAPVQPAPMPQQAPAQPQRQQQPPARPQMPQQPPAQPQRQQQPQQPPAQPQRQQQPQQAPAQGNMQFYPNPSAQTTKMPSQPDLSDPLGGQKEDEYVLKALSILKILNIVITGLIIVTNCIFLGFAIFQKDLAQSIPILLSLLGVIYVGAIWHLILCWFRGMYRHSMNRK